MKKLVALGFLTLVLTTVFLRETGAYKPLQEDKPGTGVIHGSNE